MNLALFYFTGSKTRSFQLLQSIVYESIQEIFMKCQLESDCGLGAKNTKTWLYPWEAMVWW